MKRAPVTLIFGLLTLSSLYGQTLHYDVIRNGDSMGSTVVHRTKSGDKLTYDLITKTQFRILFSFKVEYGLKETFEDGVLINGSGFNTLNGSMQKEIEMRQQGDLYELIIDGIRTEVHEKGITESVSEIYFEEPYHKKTVYSAYFARYLYFEKVGDHQYSLTSPDGVNVYTYENGIVTEVEITRDFANFSQVLKPESLAAVRNKKITSSHD